jgi:hypothetical protein
MVPELFSPEDLVQIQDHGLEKETVMAQIEVLRKPLSYQRLKRPCTTGDGVQTIRPSDHQALARLHQEAANQSRFLKFVPASGAATRMFKLPLWAYNNVKRWNWDEMVRQGEGGDQRLKDLISFFDGLQRFAFFDDLKSAMAKNGLDIKYLINTRQLETILKYLMTPLGLNYAALPKGLLKFHRYPDHSRTAFEEHLVEAAEYVRDARGVCRLHFTASAKHRAHFENLLSDVRPQYERTFHARLEVDFSVQKPCTDTIAVDMEGQPFRLDDGRLLFRPGGHGALIENLNDLRGDIIFVKNIDNVIPDRLKDLTFRWKRALAGYLLRIQKKLFSYMGKMESGPCDQALLDEVLAFAERHLCLPIPKTLKNAAAPVTQDFLLSKLKRPLRVCGVVRNVGEPGGGPFWVEGKDGTLSLQIVEKAQVDFDAEDQEEIWASATHFNPVDIVCGVRDHKGYPFNLKRFVDPNAYLITPKSKGEQELKALELPGLWNGAMAFWNTIFIEVPIETFNPVKTVLDLLRDVHQCI